MLGTFWTAGSMVGSERSAMESQSLSSESSLQMSRHKSNSNKVKCQYTFDAKIYYSIFPLAGVLNVKPTSIWYRKYAKNNSLPTTKVTGSKID